MDEWTLNDLLECSVCLERLDTSSRVLPCQHTFCKKCLEEIVHRHKKLRCPECRVLVEVDIENLPPNVLLMRILEGMRNAPRKVSADAGYVQVMTDCIQENGSSNGTIKSIDDRFRFLCNNGVKKITDRHEESDSQNNATKFVDEFCDRDRILYNQHSKFSDVPHALALYRFNAKEPGDLTFRKGDTIILLRKIDSNWCLGKCNGVSGVFPLQYVKVIVPLPLEHISYNPSPSSLAPQTPQCKALYDFSKYHEDDEVCLHFNKGDIIVFSRRIDENWAEGMMKSRIGIFPISFVEMNSSAKALMNVPAQDQSRSRDAPPTPMDESVPLISVDQTRASIENTQTYTSSQTQVDPLTSPSSSSSSSSTQSTATTTSPTSSESTTPSPTLSPVSNHAAIKRHSYTMGAVPPPYQAPPAVHRHSAEIINSDENVVTNVAESMESSVETHNHQMTSSTSKSSSPSQMPSVSSTHHHSLITPLENTENYTDGQTKSHIAVTDDNITPTRSLQVTGNKHLGRQGSLRINNNQQKSFSNSTSLNPPPLPAKYLALFPYKPQKADELELCKDRMYTVTERCQDGWFKGLDGKKCGVFPGNYVMPVRSVWSGVEKCGFYRNVYDMNVPTSHVRTPYTSKTVNAMSIVNSGIVNGTRSTPPDLPPRAASPILSSAAIVSSGYANIWCPPNIATARQSSVKHPTSSANNKKVYISRVNKENKDVPSNAVINSPSSLNGSSSGNNNSVNSGDASKEPKSSASKDRKDKASSSSSSSLMKRLANMKMSRSPPPFFSVDNPAFGDVFGPPSARSQHARSDSCPSQLSYNVTALDNSIACSTDNGNIIVVTSNSGSVRRHMYSPTINSVSSSSSNSVSAANNVAGSSQRVTREKYFPQEKPDKRDTNVAGKNGGTIILHQKSSSLDTTTSAGTSAKTMSSEDMRAIKQMKSSSAGNRERYRCVVPYPPNSEFELELRVGDIIHVHRKRDDGWYKGTVQRNGRTGLFPASFVELVQ